MTTFLEYVCHELLGPPAYGTSWHCPYCDPNGEYVWASFSVRPPMGKHPIKFKCHHCHKWGDEYDLLKLVYPSFDYEACRMALLPLREDFEREHSDSPLGEKITVRAPSSIAQRGVKKVGRQAERLKREFLQRPDNSAKEIGVSMTDAQNLPQEWPEPVLAGQLYHDSRHWPNGERRLITRDLINAKSR